MTFRFKRLLAFLPGQDGDEDKKSNRQRRSSSAFQGQAQIQQQSLSTDGQLHLVSGDLEPDEDGSLSKSTSKETLKRRPSNNSLDLEKERNPDRQGSTTSTLPMYEEQQESSDADNFQLCSSPTSDDLEMAWDKPPVPLKVNTQVSAENEMDENTPRPGQFPPSGDKMLPHARESRPALDRLPSEAISISSSASQDSERSGTVSPRSSLAASHNKRVIGHSPLVPQSSSPEAMDDASQDYLSHAPKRKKIPHFSFSEHHESPGDDSGDLSLAPSMSRTSSRLSQISAPSTPTGFRQHRASNSASGRPSEIKETLDAHIRHVSHTSSHSSNHEGDEDDDCPGGTRLNQYTLGKTLGKGSAGIVKLATDEAGVQYAVKEFSKSMLRRRKRSELLKKSRRRMIAPGQSLIPQDDDEEKSDALALIRGEVAVMKKLDHPNLVRLYEVLNVQESDSLYMVLELCSGGPIAHVSNPSSAVKESQTAEDARREQQSNSVGEDLARNYFRQIILGVEYLHANDIAHRDIKCENILLMEDRVVCKIVDFGVSEMFVKHGDDISTRTVGSPAFMSPELCDSHHNAGIHARATDIWAMGVTLYCLVIGRLPFQSSNFLELNDLIKAAKFDVPDSVSEELTRLFHRLFEKDPDKRITLDGLREDDWVTQYKKDPLPSKEDNLDIVEEPTNNELQTALGMGKLASDIVSAVRVSKALKRMINDKSKQKRGLSMHSADSSGSRTAFDDGSLPTTPASASWLPSHGKRQSLSIDDSNIDDVRYVEESTGNEVVRRDSDLSLAHHHKRSASRSSGKSGKIT